MIPAISAAALGRRYRDQVALDNISLTVEPGTVTGLLGRNGAGKTTLMRVITGLEFPTAGAIRVFGQVPAENDAVLRRMVFVREEQQSRPRPWKSSWPGARSGTSSGLARAPRSPWP